jgi:hypothetical protein
LKEHRVVVRHRLRPLVSFNYVEHVTTGCCKLLEVN